ncbi:ATP-binding protein [Paraburkholderia sp. BCC1884]|uniref:ATP-binding protein n=1 Tax=Paraburkholderia sp. BCC1884 TaxID=2562668 RepID=UPI001182AFB1|nr:winged helix-turn-helix domain-containing protein [Paraburkholderia sp. BCC1884]
MDASAFPHDDFAFGTTIVVPRRRELLHKGVKIEVGDRAFDLLLFLVQSRGSVLSKDNIIASVWNNRVVEDNTVEGQISALRRALGEDRSAIRTVTGRGYQFTGELAGKGAKLDGLASAQTEAPAFPGVTIPADICPLIGREVAVEEVRGLLTRHRLITLVGSGGVGKTRLALEAARQSISSFDDGVYIAELAATTSPDYLPTTIAVALGYPPGDGTPSLDRLAPTLLSRRLLLVLDNCEHLIDASARMAERLLRVAPRAIVLATSREPLRVPGEVVYRVPSLEVPPEEDRGDAREFGAVRLFEERAGTDARLSWDPVAALRLESRICRHLDGIPLALELAAACVPVFGLQGVADRLENRFQILTHGARTALPRQQTLRATLDWSYGLLSGLQQTVLNRLGMFAGTFTMESALGMVTCSDIPPDSVIAAIIELVDKSLLSVTSSAGNVRYRLLESTRAYAKEKLQEGGTLREWSGRHARYCLELFEPAEQRASSREDVDWRNVYVQHLDDLRAAMMWSFGSDGDRPLAVRLTVSSIPFLMHLALLKECQARVDESLDWLSTQDSRVDERHMKLYAARGMSLLCHTVGTETGDAFQSTVNIAGDIGNLDFELLGMWGRWMCHYLNGEFEQAIALSGRFHRVASLSVWPCDQLAAHRLTGMSLLFAGDIDHAIDELSIAAIDQTSLTRSHRMRFLYDEKMLSYASLALALWLGGNPDEARAMAHQSLVSARELDHPVSICYALSEAVCTLALVCGDDSSLEDAVAALVVETRRHSISTWHARAQMWQGLLDMRAGNTSAFAQMIYPAMENIGSKRFYLSLTPFVTATVDALTKHGKIEQATDVIEEAVGRALRTGDKSSLPELLRAKAEVLMADRRRPRLIEAEQVLVQAMESAGQYGFLSLKLRCAMSLANLEHVKGIRSQCLTAF